MAIVKAVVEELWMLKLSRNPHPIVAVARIRPRQIVDRTTRRCVALLLLVKENKSPMIRHAFVSGVMHLREPDTEPNIARGFQPLSQIVLPHCWICLQNGSRDRSFGHWYGAPYSMAVPR
jgi:hypothetical protein